MRTQQNIDFEEHIKQYVETYFPIFIVLFSLESVPIKSYIPICEVLQEFNERWNDIVKFVLSHFLSDTSQKKLKRRLNPFISDIESRLKLFDIFGEFEVLIRFRLVFGDILDEETICIVPWEEYLPHDSFYSIL